jgi:parallel beta-helix repeat protein
VEASSGVTITDSTLRDNRSFGIKIADSTDVVVRDNDIGHNETGIEISRAGEGVVIEGNRIFHNDRMVTASRGGNGIVFHLTTGAITVAGNRLWGNRAPHLDDAGYDGGAFEVYGASNLVITDNLLWDNNNTMETGTDGVAPCAGNVFTRNTIRALGTVPGQTEGMILRCAEGMRVTHNTFDGLDGYAFYVSADGAYAGSIAGLRIVNNIVVRGRAFSLAAGLPTGLVIDHNVVNPGGSTATYGTRVAYVEGVGNTDSLAVFTTWTGYMVHGLQADPRFTDPDGGDYRLASGSPAIDAGADLGDPYRGAAPDPGRHEAGS